MRRSFPTLALIGAAVLGGLCWQQAGLADGRGDGAPPQAAGLALAVGIGGEAAPQARPDHAGALAVAPSPHAGAIRDLLAAAPGDEREAAALAYRQRGPEAFAALREALAPAVADYGMAKHLGMTDRAAEFEPLVRLLDTVAAQRDAYAAGLYWYTDMDAAKAQAQATGKPILSLRMLGNLDDEYSCANSRFFRTALYADAQLGDTLREKFILHWQSVRPVPVITIDMGDGRVIRRTITGNSCHLILDPQGRPVDVIPGLYGPRTFEELVERAAGYCGPPDQPRDRISELELKLHHMQALGELDRTWAVLTNPGGDPFSQMKLSGEDGLALRTADQAPDAEDAGLIAGGKYAIERPLVGAVLPVRQEVLAVLVNDSDAESLPRLSGTRRFEADERPVLPFEELMEHYSLETGQPVEAEGVAGGMDASSTEEYIDSLLHADRAEGVVYLAPQDASAEVWESVAAFYAVGAELDASSRQLMHHKAVPAEVAARMAFGKSRVEDPLLAMVQNFEHAIALDTARNEHLLHRQIHQWFIDGTAPMDPDELTSRVYAELFLTPDEDPWLGLVPADTYSALDAGGLETCE